MGQKQWQQHTGGDSEWGGNVGSNTLDETQTWGGNNGGNTLEETQMRGRNWQEHTGGDSDVGQKQWL